eukprot:scaffold15773_cov193-Alexandrium_tamarense.AAC.9
MPHSYLPPPRISLTETDRDYRLFRNELSTHHSSETDQVFRCISSFAVIEYTHRCCEANSSPPNYFIWKISVDAILTFTLLTVFIDAHHHDASNSEYPKAY